MTFVVPDSFKATFNALTLVLNEMQERQRVIDDIKRDYFEFMANRNADVVASSNRETEDAIKDALFSWTHRDDVHLVRISGTAQHLNEMSAKLQEIGGHALGLVHTLESTIAALRTELTQIKAKGRQHPLHDPEVRRQVLDVTGGKCFYCAEEISDTDPNAEKFHVDHIVPKDAGGPDHLCNYVPACQSCNISKSNKHFGVFVRQKLGHIWDRKPDTVEQPALKVIEGGAA